MATQVQIPPIKTGVDFLASSHFNIGDVQEAFHHTSTFQNYYLPQKANRVSTTQKPPPAHIMHGDHRITKSSFVDVTVPPRRTPFLKTHSPKRISNWITTAVQRRSQQQIMLFIIQWTSLKTSHVSAKNR